MDPTIDQDEFEALKQKIKNMLISPTDKSFQKLSLIDAVQRLGVAYHFEREIEDELEKLSHDEYDGNDVHTVALRFRLLRQQGYRISCGNKIFIIAYNSSLVSMYFRPKHLYSIFVSIKNLTNYSLLFNCYPCQFYIKKKEFNLKR